jgi:hypothetical protein
MKSCLAILLILAMPSLALAEVARPSTESVTVTGTRDRQVLDNFVHSFAAPARMTGKLSRWEEGICPITVGLRPSATKFITQRVKDVAAQVGAPVDSSETCRPNIGIVFTTAPQALMDNVREKQPWFLGYSDNSAKTAKLATVTRPIQSWYMTATKDLMGNIAMDSARRNGVGLRIPCPGCPGGDIYLQNAISPIVSGSRLGDGLHSILFDVVIVVDPTKLVEYEIGSLADYIAMLALTQLNSLDTCQQLPSIVNMLATNCENKASALTDNDLAYLRGLYGMNGGLNLGTQKDQIAYRMEHDLKDR